MGTPAEDVWLSYCRWVIAEDLARRNAVIPRRSLMEDSWRGLLEAELDKLFESPKLRTLYKAHASTFCNPFERIVSKRATVYKYGVRRKFKSEENGKKYQELASAVKLNRRMAIANESVEAYNLVALHPCILGTETEEWDGGAFVTRKNGRAAPRPALHIYTPENFTPFGWDDDPTEARAVAFYRYFIDGGKPRWYVDIYDDTYETRYATIGAVVNATASKARRPSSVFNGILGPLIYQREHKIGRLPVILLQRKQLVADVVDPHSGQKLIDTTFDIAKIWCYASRAAFLQGHRQPTLSTNQPHAKVRRQLLDGGSLLVGEGNFGVIDLQANPAVFIDQINARISWIAAAFDLPPSSVRLNEQGQLTFDNAALNEARTDQIVNIYTDAEAEVYDVFARSIKAQGYPLSLDIEDRPSVDFGMASVTGDAKSQQELRHGQIADAIRKPQDFIAEDNPELSDDEVEARYEENLAARRKHMETAIMANQGAAPTTDGGPARPPDQNGAMGPLARDGNLGPQDVAAMRGKPPTG